MGVEVETISPGDGKQDFIPLMCVYVYVCVCARICVLVVRDFPGGRGVSALINW